MDSQPDAQPYNIMPLVTYCWQRMHKTAKESEKLETNIVKLQSASEQSTSLHAVTLCLEIYKYSMDLTDSESESNTFSDIQNSSDT